MLAAALALVPPFGQTAAPPALEPSLATEVALEALPDGPPRVERRVVIPVDGELVAWAGSAALDVRLCASLGPDSTCEDAPHHATSLVRVDARAGDEVLLRAEATEPGCAELGTVLVPTDPRLQRALAAARDLLAELPAREDAARAAELVDLAARPLLEGAAPLPPGGLAVAFDLGRAARHRGRLDLAVALVRRAADSPWIPPGSRAATYRSTVLGVLEEESGDLARAALQWRRALAVLESVRAEEDPERVPVGSMLGTALARLGELDEARAVLRRTLATLELHHPEDWRARMGVDVALANCAFELGDLLGASAAYRRALSLAERHLPEEHPERVMLLGNLAMALSRLGEHGRALELFRRVADHWDGADRSDERRLLALTNLATALRWRDPEEALRLYDEVLAARAAHLPPDHPALQSVRMNRATVLLQTGEVERGLEELERVLAVRERLLPADHPHLLETQEETARVLAALGRHEEAGEVLERCLDGHRRLVRSAAAHPGRERRARLRATSSLALELLAGFDRELPPDLEIELFELLETLRAAEATGRELPADLPPELGPLAARRDAARADVAALARWTEEPAPVDELRLAVEARDRAETAWLDALAARDLLRFREISLDALRRALPPGAAAVGFRSTGPVELLGRRPGDLQGGAALVAFVVAADGLELVGLGSADEARAAVEAWRAALGVLGAVGTDAEHRADDERAAGEALRRAVLDPVLAAAPGARALFVCLDDALHGVPLDALPGGDGVLLGERVAVHVLGSFAELLAPAPEPVADRLLVVGAVDFGRGDAFELLPGSAREVEAVARRFEGRHAEGGVRRLSGPGATKAAVRAAAPGARFLHVATHGRFAGEAGDDRMLIASAPSAFCGIALAGANAGRDASGRLPGILTAEELAALDLRGCELAVLSACDGGVGLHQAGLGVHSLQTALHAAGARRSLAALWPVPDSAARELFGAFYAALWDEDLPPHEALWRAKMHLRRDRRPTREWAGWILVGVP